MLRSLRIVAIALPVASASLCLVAQEKRAIIPEDCVSVRYLQDDYAHSPIKINPQGALIAYLVRSPNLLANRNDMQLYIRDLADTSNVQGRLLMVADHISQMNWLQDGRHLVVLAGSVAEPSIVKVDVVTGAQEPIATSVGRIIEYTIDRKGDTLVFAVREEAKHPEDMPTKEEVSRGYRIPFQSDGVWGEYRAHLYIRQISPNGLWSNSEPIALDSPFTHQRITSFHYPNHLYLSLSPDGKKLLFGYTERRDRIPQGWAGHDGLTSLIVEGEGIDITVLWNLESGATTIPLKSPEIWSVPLWSPDSQSFVVVATSPMGSEWDRKDIADPLMGKKPHMFWIKPSTGEVTQVASHVVRPLWWSDSGLGVQTAANVISTFTKSSGAWMELSRLQISLPDAFPFSELAGDGQYVVGDYQNAATPPQMFVVRPGQKSPETLAALNPQFENLTIAGMQRVHWKTSTGYDISGLLFLPPNYVRGGRYPLVIQTKPDKGSFVCDSGENHDPAFAPQPIANAGMMYLIRYLPWDYNPLDDSANWPKGYPGKLGEAAFHMDIWDSAVESLAHRGLVDSSRVGIIGFSRSGWYTEFILTHSHIPYKAATLADNLHMNLSEYWLYHSKTVIQGADAMFGGPPYGATLKNWQEHSISFNVDKIHAPILMEEMGYGVLDDRPNSTPNNLAQNYELFTGLNRLSKPVEMYYYPNDVHQPNEPQTRLASLRRNVDWYRFWLLGEEPVAPDDPDRYARWRKLRDLQEQDTFRGQ